MLLTAKQQKVLEFIQNYILTRGFPPTIREIAEGLGFKENSIYSVQRILRILEQKGFLKRNARKPRGIELLHFKLSNAVLVPLVGKVSAGFPIPAIEEIEGNIVLDSIFLKDTKNTIALKIKGNSMIGAGILDGDIVIVKIGVEVKNNDIVVAFVDNEVTCKRLKVTDESIQLVPENPEYKIIEIRREEARLYILGKVVGLFRRID